MWPDDSECKQLKGALDLRYSRGQPTNYQPDSVKLQAYYADITQLVLLNPSAAISIGRNPARLRSEI
jgi:hypothetical protein